MVGRKPAPLMPRKKKKPSSAPKHTAEKKKPNPIEQPDEEILDRSTPSSPTKRKKQSKTVRMRRGIKPSAPQQQLSTEDKRVMRRRRQRRRLASRIVALVAVCALAAVVWLNWDILAPEKVWAKFQDWMGGGTGSFPVDLSGIDARRLEQADRYTVVLSDSHLIYLNASGAEISRYGCAYADPLMRAEGKYVLVAEQGGQRLHLSTRNKIINEWETEYAIRAVSMNAEGQCAVLTDGPQGYQVQLRVYDVQGELLYTRNSNRNAVDVALAPDGTTVSLTAVEAVDGTLNTHLEMFSTTEGADLKCSHVAANTLLYRIEYLSGGMLAAVSEQGVLLMNPDGGAVTTYAPQGMRVLGYAVSGDTVALALRHYGETAGGEVEVISTAGAVQSNVVFTGEFRHLSGVAGNYTLLTDGYVQVLDATGSKGKAAVLSDGRQAVYAEGKAVVMGRNQLNAYTMQ